MNRLSDYDVFLLSYDEPNADENYADLKVKFPLAKRVHGVKGFDNAHKTCANNSSTRRFITIDGDSQVIDGFFDQTIPDELANSRKVLSWDARNVVNGLVYGNGGPKCWTREFALEMKTHEHSETDSESVDFCYDDDYKHIRGEWTTTHPNGSREQAFRAGFREGVKMALDKGVRVKPIDRKRVIQPANNLRLSMWCSVGADVKNGFWCMYGARTGAYMTTTESFDPSEISDFDCVAQIFSGILDTEKYGGEEEINRSFEQLGKMLTVRLDVPVANLDVNGSLLFKQVMESIK